MPKGPMNEYSTAPEREFTKVMNRDSATLPLTESEIEYLIMLVTRRRTRLEKCRRDILNKFGSEANVVGYERGLAFCDIVERKLKNMSEKGNL